MTGWRIDGRYLEDLGEYFKMTDELRESGWDLLDTAKKRQEDRYLLTLCGARMLTAGNEFERLLRHVAEYLTRMEDDGK